MLDHRVTFAADDVHKIVTVLRKRSGDRVEVVDSGGAAFAATLEIDGRAVSATLRERLERRQVESALQITLAQAIPKGQKMDLVVEKTTELGVQAIVPVRSARVIGDRTGEPKLERWRRIARSAAEQSGRTHVPDVAAVHDWSALLATFSRYDAVLLPWELEEAAPLRDALEKVLAAARDVLVVIGPEGGFGADEVERARGAGARTVSLGPRILRTETAGLVLLAVILYARGEL